MLTVFRWQLISECHPLPPAPETLAGRRRSEMGIPKGDGVWRDEGGGQCLDGSVSGPVLAIYGAAQLPSQSTRVICVPWVPLCHSVIVVFFGAIPNIELLLLPPPVPCNFFFTQPRGHCSRFTYSDSKAEMVRGARGARGAHDTAGDTTKKEVRSAKPGPSCTHSGSPTSGPASSDPASGTASRWMARTWRLDFSLVRYYFSGPYY